MKVRAVATEFIDLNYRNASDDCRKGEQIEPRMDVLAHALLARRVAEDGLLDEDGLREREDGGRHGNGVAGEEDDGAEEHVCPDVGADDGDAELGEGAGSC